VRTDRFAQARSKHRRGGSLKVWKVTKVGERWALELANIQRAAAVKRYTAQVEAEPWPSILRANYQVVNGDHRRAATRRIRRRIETVLDDEG
jgi:hypothetical protein